MRTFTADHVRRMLADAITKAGSQQTLASAIGISPQYLSDMVHGRRTIGAGVLAYLGLVACERMYRRVQP